TVASATCWRSSSPCCFPPSTRSRSRSRLSPSCSSSSSRSGCRSSSSGAASEVARSNQTYPDAVTVLSADWVLPVDGAPIRDGAVAFQEGAIVAVGTVSELGEGQRFRDAVILPGFVDAHSHLEYEVYAGFGDGLPFAPWIALHIARKAELDVADMEATARAGAADCLRSGITTVGDASYCGAAATACDELGLRAIVHFEVFG